MAVLVSDWLRSFIFSSATAERISTKFVEKEDLNFLYQVCVFRTDKKPRLPPLFHIDWRTCRYSRPLLCNRWSEFNETWQEVRSQIPLQRLCFSRSEIQDDHPGLWFAETFSTWQETRSQRPIPSLCFSGRSEKQDGRLGFWLTETFSTFSLQPLNGIHWNLIGSNISNSSKKFVFPGPITKPRWPPWHLIGWYIFDIFSAPVERNSTKLVRKQDHNVFYQFFGSIGKQRWLPWLLIGWYISTFSLQPLNGIRWNLIWSKISNSSTKFVFPGPLTKPR